MATETKILAPATATNKAELENPEKTLTETSLEASASATQNPAKAVSLDEKAASGGAEEETNGVNGAPASDVERKVRRAERFGVPLQLSEQEKRNSRAERFGRLSGSGGSKATEELKRKSRAERFGLAENSAADEEVKKKACLARFGSNTKPDPQEEEKRKARALRFAQSPANSQSDANGKGNIEMKTAVTGNTIGGA